MKDKIHGKIKWYDNDLGYGYINGDDEDIYFFNCLNVINNNKLKANEDVYFIPNYGEFTYATKIEKVKK